MKVAVEVILLGKVVQSMIAIRIFLFDLNQNENLKLLETLSNKRNKTSHWLTMIPELALNHVLVRLEFHMFFVNA